MLPQHPPTASPSRACVHGRRACSIACPAATPTRPGSRPSGCSPARSTSQGTTSRRSTASSSLTRWQRLAPRLAPWRHRGQQLGAVRTRLARTCGNQVVYNADTIDAAPPPARRAHRRRCVLGEAPDVRRRALGRAWATATVVRVRYGECDMQQVVFNANYLAYVDDAIDTWMREVARALVRGARLRLHGEEGHDRVAVRRPAAATSSSSTLRSRAGARTSFDVDVQGAGRRAAGVLRATLVYVSTVPGQRRRPHRCPTGCATALGEPCAADSRRRPPGRSVLSPCRRSFYDRDSRVVAPELLGKVLVAGACRGRIVEVEAYAGGRGPGQPRLPRADALATPRCSGRPATSTSTSRTGCTGAPTR